MQAILEKFSNGVQYVIIEEAYIMELQAGGNKRAICILNHIETFHCALMQKNDGYFYITIGSKICKKLKLHVGDTVSFTLAKDESEHQFEMPQEFEEVLNTDATAKEVFEQLTPGKQRSLLYLVSLPKSSDKKIERALLIAEKIKKGVTLPQLILKR
jgi:hypothetical protein